MNDTSRMGRQDLINALDAKEKELRQIAAERDSYNINLTSVQTRCTALINANRALDSLIKDLRLDESRLNWLEEHPARLTYVQVDVAFGKLTVREAIEKLRAT